MDEKENILGVLALEYHYTWYANSEAHNKVVPHIIIKDGEKDAEGQLIEYAKEWCENHRQVFNDKKISLCLWLEDNEYEAMQKYIAHGFAASEVVPCLKFDLTNEISDYSLPEGMVIEELPFNEESVNQFIHATELAHNGTSDSINELWFMTGEPTYKIFVVKDRDRIVSTASVWKITEERTAVENICTIPEYRKRNLARAVIAHALRTQKAEGYQYATLSVKGKNKKALSLYISLGFTIYYNLIEMHFE